MPASRITIGQKWSRCLGRRIARPEGLHRADVLLLPRHQKLGKLGKYPDFTFEPFQGI
jgi:hypothetical protein